MVPTGGTSKVPAPLLLFFFFLYDHQEGIRAFRFWRIKTSLLTLLALGIAPNSNHRNHKPPHLPCNVSTVKVVASDVPVLVRAPFQVFPGSL